MKKDDEFIFEIPNYAGAGTTKVDIRDLTKKQYQDKFYAWYHCIAQAIGSEDQFPKSYSKQEIVTYGKNHYTTKGVGFYKAYIHFDLNNFNAFVRSLSEKDRSAWKDIIIDISNSDADIVAYLRKIPN